MGIECRIKFAVPADYDPGLVFQKLPSPINRTPMAEIYNYAIEADGFYFVDHLLNREIASVAFRLLVDEALRFAGSIAIAEA